MKKSITLLSLLVSAVVVHAQVVKINILSPVFRTLNVQYEQAISKNSSLQLGFFYTGYKDGDLKFSGIGITPEFRYYLSNTDAPEGVYIAPFVRYQSFTLEHEPSNDKGTYTAFGGGLILGKQWIFKNKITLDLFIGPSYSSGDLKVKSGDGDSLDVDVFDGFGLRTGICFGFKF
jgi:hypothetical protein